jgi:hypothetical protein
MLQWLREKLNLSGPSERAEDHPSAVILLRQAQILTQDEVQERGLKAWGAGGPVELISTLNGGGSFVLRCGKFIFAIHQAAQRYEAAGREQSDVFQRPWDEHTAWMSVDFPQSSSRRLREIDSLGSCYKMLLVFVFLCWSPNCLAVYFPMEGITIPNLGDLAGSVKWVRQNGIRLDFLKDK